MNLVNDNYMVSAPRTHLTGHLTWWKLQLLIVPYSPLQWKVGPNSLGCKEGQGVQLIAVHLLFTLARAKSKGGIAPTVCTIDASTDKNEHHTICNVLIGYVTHQGIG